MFTGNIIYKGPALRVPYSDQSVDPSVIRPSFCLSEISCLEHIFSPVGPIWLILHLQSVYDQRVNSDLELCM